MLDQAPKRDFTQAYNEMLQANQVLNNPNLGGASFTPKKSLVDIYNQASAKNTPAWAMALSNAMPSIGEIVANATIKNGFQQRPVAESLERQKQRQQAYNQWLQENEQNQAKDFVQIAKEQLGMDIADDERKWNREQTTLDKAYKKAIDERNFNNMKEQQSIENELKFLANNRSQDMLDLSKQEFDFNKQKQKAIELQQLKDNAFKDRQLKLQEEQAKQQALTKAIEESAKAKQKQLDGYVSTAENMFNKGLISNETLWAIKQNPELAETLVPKSTWLGFAKSSKKMELGNKTNNDYEIMQDANGNRAKVYKDGRIEEI